MILQVQKKRRFPRFTANQKSQYCLQEMYGSWKECTVHTISRKGVGIALEEQIDVGSKVCLEVPLPHKFAPLSIEGTLRWIIEKENGFHGGIEFNKVLDDEHFSMLG